MKKLRNFFSKKKLVSYDSKSPNSARNAKKNFFLVATEIGGERRSRRRFFLKIPKLWVIIDSTKRFYPIISKTKRLAPKIKLLIYCVTRQDIFPPPSILFLSL